MKYKLTYVCLSSLFLLSACIGGGGGGGGGNESGGSQNPPVNVETPIEPQIILQIDTADVQINKGDALPVVFTGKWTAVDLDKNSLYIKIHDESNTYINTAVSLTLENEEFSLETALSHSIQVGEHSPTITAVACEDANCENIYQNSNITINFKIKVDDVPEWQTHQANASHNGYVPIWIDNHNFEKLWEWRRASSAGMAVGGINAPVAGKGQVYVATDVYFSDAAVFSLDELTGEENWRFSFGNMPSLNPPAINGETLFISTSGHQDTSIWAIDRMRGQLEFKADFSSQWGNYLAPTVFGDKVFQTGGYFGGHTYAFSIESGEEVWTRSPGASWGMDTPAVDDQYVYVHSGTSLSIFDKESGDYVSDISDPFGNTNYSYHGSPVIGSTNNVLAYSGGAFSGRASSNAEHYDERVISNFDIANKEHVWSSQHVYKTFFATSNGVVYAGRSNPAILDAIDEETGEILWSWAPPSADNTSFHRNIVVTKNVLFVSTNTNLYAIDLATKEPVWSYGEPGMISISDNRILFLAPGARESDGRLLAFDLRSK